MVNEVKKSSPGLQAEAEKSRYNSLDGLRAYSAIGIIMMHVLVNGQYALGGFVFNELIVSFTDLVYLFMAISGFSMCCGYYDKIVNGQIDLGKFYSKRFAKVWPFFAVLCVMDFAVSPSVNTLYELIADLTLCFGLIPNANISVIGVGWFLGVAFVFYYTFPFFCSLLSDKKRAWLAFGVTFLLNLLCKLYFDVTRASIAFSAVYFMIGGMIYLYREALRKFAERFGWAVLLGVTAFLVLYYLLGRNTLVAIPVCALILIWAIRPQRRTTTVLSNSVTKMLSGISMEIYLCHMLVYRVLEKLKLVNLFPSPLLSFAVAFVGTLAGAIVMSLVINRALSWLTVAFQRIRKNSVGCR